MKIFIDVAHCSLTKYGEELCGDKVEIVKLPQCTIIVLADGLGSGVKANILATLTTKISATMLKEGADIYETLDTIASTLPVCKEREIAYSTFTLIKISNEGKVYMAEYDNPKAFILSGKEEKNIEKKKLIINNRKIYESTFNVKPGDSITIVSDGIIHAGLGNTMNFGWTWDNVLNYIQRNIENKNDAHSIAKDLVEVCWDLYGHKPGDDATVVNIKIKRPEYVDLF
ncbi:SpoIIE family protein phosphatase, partial [Clostridium cochlearium]|uniref:SpoIIE family protein phosphatase n=1 Tax=Clostridium cochlearium TaxID=1494 RepID=UPI001EDFF226